MATISVLLFIDSTSGSNCISIGSQYTEVGGAIVRENPKDHWVQVVGGIVSGVVFNSGAHVVSCTAIQHIIYYLTHYTR